MARASGRGEETGAAADGAALVSPELSLPPLALYVHLPWCERKCPYCDFNSYQTRQGATGPGIPFDEARYLAALKRDLAASVPAAAGRPLTSIFIGGGTPSLFSPDAIAAVLEAARDELGFAHDVEITLEANPGSVERGRFEGYRAGGVNRLSIGVQSFRNDMLKVLGRVHDADDARRALTTVRDAGFDNFNLDLMFALPGDDEAGSRYDLTEALAFAPPHLSWYQLTLEPGTAFGARPPELPEEDVQAAIEDGGRALLVSRGYERYEISGWAQPGREARHNRNYWTYGDYLGIGAGAHGKLTEGAVVVRTQRPRHPERYMATAGTPEGETREVTDTATQRAEEFLMNALRLTEGFSLAAFMARTGYDAATLRSVAKDVSERRAGWLEANTRCLRATDAGRLHLDTLLVELCERL